MGLNGHNALRGRSLPIVVRDAVKELAGPTEITTEVLCDYLCAKYEPTMPYSERLKLAERVVRATAELANSGLINREKKPGTKRIEYYTYSPCSA